MLWYVHQIQQFMSIRFNNCGTPTSNILTTNFQSATVHFQNWQPYDKLTVVFEHDISCVPSQMSTIEPAQTYVSADITCSNCGVTYQCCSSVEPIAHESPDPDVIELSTPYACVCPKCGYSDDEIDWVP